MIFPKQKEGSYLPFNQLFKLLASPACYPGTEVLIEPGDILYSSKGWSTFLMGHISMVGQDYRIYHAHPAGGLTDRLPNYLSRHKFGTTITVLRPKKQAQAAAEWAMNNVGLVKRYFFDPRIGKMEFNYCTKFIWQAFWHSGCGDITGRNLTPKKIGWIYPLMMKHSDFFEEKAAILLGMKK